MKINPVAEHAVDVAQTRRVKDFLKGYVEGVMEDVNGRQQWEENRNHFYRRRYGMAWRNPTFPWPNSSDIVMPLIDMMIDKLKPLYVGMVTQARPPVTVLAHDKVSMQQTQNIELWFDWLLRIGSPNFVREVVLAADDLLETGRCVLKTLWQYETRTAPETLTKERLPPRLRQLVVVPGKQEQADTAYAALGGGRTVLTEKEFDKARDAMSMVVQYEFQLDLEVAVDRRAHDEILEWLKKGAREPLTVKKRDVVVDAPRMVAVSPFDFVVPSGTTEVESCERWTHRMYLSESQFRARARDAGWSREVVNRVVEARQKGKDGPQRGKMPPARSWQYRMDQQQQAEREGIDSGQSEELYEIWESGVWFDIDQDTVDEKCIVVMCSDEPETPLKFYAYSRPSGKWPIHTAEFELNKRRWYAPRGVPEKIDDLEKEVTAQHRAKLNRMMIANAPTFKYRVSSNINPGSWRYIPGQFYPVRNIDDVAPMEVPNLDMSFEREEQVLRTWAEQYLGGTDFGLSNPLSGLDEARTASEIRAIQSSSRQSLSLRGEIFQQMMSGIYNEMFDLWHAYGPEEVWVRVTDGEPIKLTKEELQGDYLFIPTGVIGELDPSLEAQKALARIQILMQASQGGVLGDQFELDLGEALLDWLEKDDIRAARRIMRRRSPEEIQQIKQQRMQQEQEEMAARRNEAMDPATAEGALDRIAQKSKKTTGYGKNQQVAL